MGWGVSVTANLLFRLRAPDADGSLIAKPCGVLGKCIGSRAEIGVVEPGCTGELPGLCPGDRTEHQANEACGWAEGSHHPAEQRPLSAGQGDEIIVVAGDPFPRGVILFQSDQSLLAGSFGADPHLEPVAPALRDRKQRMGARLRTDGRAAVHHHQAGVPRVRAVTAHLAAVPPGAATLESAVNDEILGLRLPGRNEAGKGQGHNQRPTNSHV